MIERAGSLEGIVRAHAVKNAAAELSEGPIAEGDPDAVTLALGSPHPGAFQMIMRIFPEGGALLWVGMKGSLLGPVQLEAEDASTLSEFLDALAAGQVELTLSTYRGRSRLTRIAWPGGQWLAEVPVLTAMLRFPRFRSKVVGAPYGR